MTSKPSQQHSIDSETALCFIVQGEEKSLSKVDVYQKLWDGQLLFSSKVQYEGQWIPLEQHPFIFTGPHGGILRIIRNLDSEVVPYGTIFFTLLLNLGNWFQEEHSIARWAHGWSNVFLESRWWSFCTGFFVHSSKVHFISNVILFVFLGWRVEKALGSARFLGVILGSMLISSLTFWCFEYGMVVGASSIVFALWGAQIAIGLFFSLPIRHHSRYGWWGLLLLMVVLVYQVGATQTAHSSHLVGLWFGVMAILFYSSRFWGCIWLCCTSFCFWLGHDGTFEKKQNIDGMTIVTPKDFVAHTAGRFVVLFHPFEPSGWIIQGKESSIQNLNRYWLDYTHNAQFTEHCAHERGCLRSGTEHNMILRIVHHGTYKISWVACVYPKENQIWRDACVSWIGKVEATEPNMIQRKRIVMERYSHSPYHVEQYALSLEEWGYFHEADLIYEELEKSDWKSRAIVHRKRIQQYLTSQ